MADHRHADQDASHKSYRDILGEQIEFGCREIQRRGTGLFLSGLSAGIDISFGVLLMGVGLTLAEGSLGPLAERALMAATYAIGFIFVKLGRSELFTEHTTLIVFPVFHRDLSLGAMGRVWGLVYVGNLVGVALFSILLAWFAPRVGIVNAEVLGQIAHPLVTHSWWVILVSAIIAGWLMGLLSWLVAATSETMGQIICTWLVAATIGFAELHHSIAGSAEVLAGVLSGQGADVGQFIHFLLWATVGNALGGTVFAALKYAHAARGKQSEPVGQVG